MRRATALLLQAVGALALTGLLAACLLLFFAGQWLQINDAPAKADYILPLAGDGNRNIYAAELFEQGWAPRILVSRAHEYPPTRMDRLKLRMGYPEFPDQRAWYEAMYGALGVNLDVLEYFGNGHLSTVEEAEALRSHLKGAPVRLLLVTSAYHARRAKTIFQDVYPEAEIRMVITPYAPFEEQWWADQYSAQMVVLEAAKTLHYLLGGAYRSGNAPQ